MKLHLEADPLELASKGYELLCELSVQVAQYDDRVAEFDKILTDSVSPWEVPANLSGLVQKGRQVFAEELLALIGDVERELQD